MTSSQGRTTLGEADADLIVPDGELRVTGRARELDAHRRARARRAHLDRGDEAARRGGGGGRSRIADPAHREGEGGAGLTEGPGGGGERAGQAGAGALHDRRRPRDLDTDGGGRHRGDPRGRGGRGGRRRWSRDDRGRLELAGG